VVKRWDPKAIATATAAGQSNISPQWTCSRYATPLFCRSDHQTIDFVGCLEQASQVPNTRSYPRIFIQGHSSGSDVGFTCLANFVGQAWVCILGSLLRTIPKKGYGRRQSQEGVGGQGGRKGCRRRRACVTTEVKESHNHDIDNDLSQGLPEVYGPQDLPNTRDGTFGGEYEELEYLEARSIVILLPISLSCCRWL